jgi:hypothetical protein
VCGHSECPCNSRSLLLATRQQGHLWCFCEVASVGMCVLLAGALFLQCSEYGVVCVNVSVIHLQAIFADFVYVVFLKCV